MSIFLAGGVFPLALAVSGCASLGDATESADTTDDADTATDDPLCQDAETVTWDNFGDGFLTSHCDGCHHSMVADRNGAPEEATFDTVEEAWAWRDAILAVTTGDSATEPPGGGVTERDRTLLYWWLGCGTPGT